MTWSWDDGRDDDQWIYLPALKRVKRIASDSKNDSFMGSDFTYDDLGDRHPSEDTHTLIGEETVDGLPCYVVESVPLEKNPAYAKTITRIHKDSWVGLRKEYFDSRGELVKVLEIGKREKIDGFWVVTDMTMKDLDRGSSTRITMNAVRFDIPLNDQLFSERQMRIGQPR
jgi:outer membrane lipoprotein-sorting protein